MFYNHNMIRKITITSENDIRITLNAIRMLTRSLHFSEVDTQKLIVAVSELSRNIIDHAGSNGFVYFEEIENKGIKVIVQDFGKGIKKIDEILQGQTNFQKKGLGMGLVGAKRLMDDFSVETSKEGTRIIAVKWRTIPYKQR